MRTNRESEMQILFGMALVVAFGITVGMYLDSWLAGIAAFSFAALLERRS